MKMKHKLMPAGTTKVVLQARIPVELASQVQDLSKSAGDETTSDFVRRAIQNEVSRESLCLVVQEVSLADVTSRLDQIQQSLHLVKVHNALLLSIGEALGIKTKLLESL